jgi:predicted dehydrogenase/threonine dehydrogenase-like Zn-dependent dehydrogenase
MRQLIQRPQGAVDLVEVPAPLLRRGGVLVRTAHSVISPGTERQRLNLARKSLLAKARARPDLVKQVILRARQDGVLSTYRRVQHRLQSPIPLGYSSAGTVIAVAPDVTDLQVGDRVACAGAGYANHAEIIFCPRNLCVRIPDGMPLEHAAFGTLGAIAMQGVRQAEPTVGETVAVIGLGIIGLLSVIVARAAGCRVVGIDPVEAKRELATTLGADRVAANESDAAHAIGAVSHGIGADAVLVCASTPSSDPLTLAARVARDRARVVVVGLVGMTVPRQLYYEKELTLRLSRSYGPGRYDAAYEVGGHDYPVGYVRWTEQRNIESFLEIAARDRSLLDRLTSHRFPFEQATRAYEVLRTDPAVTGILLDYPQAASSEAATRIDVTSGSASRNGVARIGVIGAGAFAQGVLLPLLAGKKNARLHAVATASGLSARTVAERYQAKYVAADYHEILRDPEIDGVLICTRHDSHAAILGESLRQGKPAFVEKPLAISVEQLGPLVAAAHSSRTPYMVGFNRRYSPMMRAVREHFGEGAVLSMHYRVNAGPLSEGHWLHEETQGGRILGEVCHFVDTLQYVAGSEPVRVYAQAAGAEPSQDVAVVITFASGSVGTIIYAVSGDVRLGKERFEAFGAGRAAVVDDFRQCELFADGRRRRLGIGQAGKGHAQEIDAFVTMLTSGEPTSAPAESILATRATLAIPESLRLGQPVSL